MKTLGTNVQKKCRCDTWGHDLVLDLAVLGDQLDSMALEVFSNVNSLFVTVSHKTADRSLSFPLSQ